MRPWLLVVVLLLVVPAVTACAKLPACREGQVATPVRAVRSPIAGQLVHGHAHNDYEHPHPLLDALSQGFYSVEADVYYDGGRFKVAHNPWDSPRGTRYRRG